MTKMMCVILGLAFIALGFLGVTGLMPMFQSDPVYVNIGQIVLGGLGLLVGVYAKRSSAYNPQKGRSAQQRNDIDRQRKEIDQQRKDIDQQRKEIDEQKRMNTEKLEQSSAV